MAFDTLTSTTVRINPPAAIKRTNRLTANVVAFTFSLDEYVAPHIASGALVRVLEDWCPPFAGFFVYYRAGGSSPRLCQR